MLRIGLPVSVKLLPDFLSVSFFPGPVRQHRILLLDLRHRASPLKQTQVVLYPRFSRDNTYHAAMFRTQTETDDRPAPSVYHDRRAYCLPVSRKQILIFKLYFHICHRKHAVIDSLRLYFKHLTAFIRRNRKLKLHIDPAAKRSRTYIKRCRKK